MAFFLLLFTFESQLGHFFSLFVLSFFFPLDGGHFHVWSWGKRRGLMDGEKRFSSKVCLLEAHTMVMDMDMDMVVAFALLFSGFRLSSRREWRGGRIVEKGMGTGIDAFLRHGCWVTGRGMRV